MSSADGRFVISYNGEIYNHLALRDELEQASVAPAWRGHSDTETMLAAFVAWGVEASLSRFVGMFAFALWDRRQRSLYLARDRIGEKPLYYGWLHSAFAFALRTQSFCARTRDSNGEIDRGSLSLFMRHNYIPAPYSIYSGISKLLPGCLAAPGRGSARPCRAPVLDGASNRRDRHGEAVRRRCQCRCGAARSHAARRRRWTDDCRRAAGGLSFRRRRFVDRGRADAGAEQPAGPDFHDRVSREPHSTRPSTPRRSRGISAPITPSSTSRRRQALHAIPSLPGLYDEPFADSSQLPTFLLARMARQHVTVALSGDGGDELFAGTTATSSARPCGGARVGCPRRCGARSHRPSPRFHARAGTTSWTFRCVPCRLA